MKVQILNAKGEPITLTEREQRIVEVNQRLCNALGFEIDITTLTSIMKKVTEQKFFEIPPADYLPIDVGNGAWSTNLTTYRSYETGGAFEEGVIKHGSHNGRLAAVGAAVDSVTVQVRNWAKSLGWTLFELQQAAKSGNWDLVTSLEKSRKKNWDLGIQKVAFLGANGDSSVLGLLTQSAVTPNTSVITKAIKTMTTAELKTLCAALIEAYRAQVNRTAWPTHFIIPESDYNGLAAQASPDFPIKSVLQLLEESLQLITRNKSFKILPLAYADATYSGLTVQRYVLLNYDPESIRMDIPVDYTNTLANSIDNFSFQNVGYGQFTGVGLYRPLELMYFDYNV